MKKTLRFLTIDDEQAILTLITKLLKHDFPDADIIMAGDAVTMERCLEDGGFDLVITDYEFKWGNGLEVLRRVKARDSHCPVIMFTGSGSEELAVEAMKAGLDDYVIKSSSHIKRLLVSIHTVLERHRERAEKKHVEDQLATQSLFLDRIIRQSPFSTFVMDAAGVCVKVNQAFLDHHHVPDESMVLGLHVPTFPPVVAQGVDIYLLKALAGELVQTPEMEYESPTDGSRTVARTTAIPIFNNIGALTHVAVFHEDVTGRVRVNEELKKSEERYRSLVENSLQGILILQDGCLVYGNRALCDLTGYSLEELTTLDFEGVINLVHPDSRENIKKRMIGRRQGIVPDTPARVKITRKDGTERWIEGFSSPVIHEGRPALQGTVVDITGRVEFEGMKQSHEFLDDILNAIDDPVLVKDEQHRYVLVNDSACAQAGLPRSDIIGKSDAEIYPFELAEMFRKADLDVLETGRAKLSRDEVTVGGERRIFITNKSIFTNHRTGQRYIVCSARDITELTRAAEKISEHEQNLSALVENACDGIIIVVGEGRIVFANQATVDISGYPVDELLTMAIADLASPEDWLVLANRCKKRLRGEPVEQQFETTLVRKDGTVVALAATAAKTIWQGQPASIAVLRDITARLEAEEELRESELRYRTLVESAEDLIFMVDREMRVQSINSSAARVIGVPPEKVVGKTVAELFPQDIAGQYKMSLKEVFDTGQGMVRENTMMSHQGRHGISTRLSPITDDAGQVNLVLGVSRDITDRKQAEDALRESESRYRTLFEDSPISLWEEDFSRVKYFLDGLRKSGVDDLRAHFDEHPEKVRECAGLVRVLNINKTTLELYEAASPEDFFGGLNKVFTEKTLEVFKEEILGFAKGLTRFEMETENLTLKGETRHTLLRACVAPGYEDSLARVFVSIIDLTQRKQAEARMQFLGSITRQIKDALIVTDADFKITYINQAAQELYGYTSEELIGVDPGILNAEPMGEMIQQHIYECLAGGQVWTGTHLNRKKGGSAFVCEMKISSLFDIQDQIYSHLSVLRDVTERRRLEKEILDISSQEQRRIGQDLHDSLGQQLTGISYMTRVLEQKLTAWGCPEASSAGELAEFIKEAITQTRELAMGLCPVDLDEMGLMSSLDKLAVQTEHMYDIVCRFRSPRDIRVADTDRATHLYRIAREAVNNAVKHARAATIAICLDSDQDNLMMTVEDDGIGIEKSGFESEGIGIRIMQYRANVIGAVIEIRKTGGTTVSCRLPLIKLRGWGRDEKTVNGDEARM